MTEADDNAEFSARDEVDPEAPWGRKADGTPKAKPGRRASGAPTAPKSPGRKATPNTSRTKGADYRPVVTSALHAAAFPLAALGQVPGQEAFMADAEAIAAHAPNIAEALNLMAMENPRLAAFLDKMGTATPGAALFLALLPLGQQIAANHAAQPTGFKDRLKLKLAAGAMKRKAGKGRKVPTPAATNAEAA